MVRILNACIHIADSSQATRFLFVEAETACKANGAEVAIDAFRSGRLDRCDARVEIRPGDRAHVALSS